MQTKLPYFLGLLIVIISYQVTAQGVEYEYVKENQDVGHTLKENRKNTEELQKHTFETVDSLSNKSIGLFNNTTDSLKHFSGHIETRVRSGIDSLQQKLSGKLQADKLNKYANTIRGEHETTQMSAVDLPGLEKLPMPGIPSLGTKGQGSNAISLTDNGTNPLTSRVDEQLGKISNIKDNEWIKTGLSEYRQISNEAGEYGEMIKDPSKTDQAIDARAGQLSEFQALSAETKELAAMRELPASMLADLKRYQDAQALKAQAKEEVVKQATDYFANHQDKLTEAQSLMTQLKKKYSYVPDSRDLSTAVKATSLKDEPLKRRLVFGMGFQLHQTNPISLDLSPNMMYRFNTLFSAGISGTYRASLGIENNKSISPNTSTDVYGVSAIAWHRVWKGFFAHGEMQYLSVAIPDPNTGADLSTRRWNEGLLLGIGKQMSFSNAISGQIIFTYDFLHDQYSPNPRAWNIKFGFQLGKFKLKDIRL